MTSQPHADTAPVEASPPPSPAPQGDGDESTPAESPAPSEGDTARTGDVPPADVAPGSAAAFADVGLDQAKLALRKVKDPDLGLNIVDLGLVYDVRVEGSDVTVDMTLTSPGCPSGPEIMGDAERMLKAMPGVGAVSVNLVWSPMWTPDRIEPRVRAYMGL